MIHGWETLNFLQSWGMAILTIQLLVLEIYLNSISTWLAFSFYTFVTIRSNWKLSKKKVWYALSSFSSMTDFKQVYAEMCLKSFLQQSVFHNCRKPIATFTLFLWQIVKRAPFLRAMTSDISSQEPLFNLHGWIINYYYTFTFVIASLSEYADPFSEKIENCHLLELNRYKEANG